jgi:hypothetical protein
MLIAVVIMGHVLISMVPVPMRPPGHFNRWGLHSETSKTTINVRALQKWGEREGRHWNRRI